MLALLNKPTRRAKLTTILAHFHDLDPRWVVEIPPARHRPSELETLLRERGANQYCHVLSENPAIDGREMPLTEALQVVVGYGYGTFLDCIPGQLAYFESEEMRQRVLLVRATE